MKRLVDVFIKPKRRQRLAYEGHDRDSTLVDFAKAVSDITVLYSSFKVAAEAVEEFIARKTPIHSGSRGT